ncbi:MAG: hypothetical protein ACE5FD_19170 [Anaerolineae bacterium]
MSAKTASSQSRHASRSVRVAGMKLGVTGLALAVLFVFLIPMVYGIVTALKTDSQFSKIGAPWWPAAERQLTYEGEEYDIYLVPIDGETRELALYKKGRRVSEFVDPENLAAGPFEGEGQWRQLERAWESDPQWGNFVEAWNTVVFLFCCATRSCMLRLPPLARCFRQLWWHMVSRGSVSPVKAFCS